MKKVDMIVIAPHFYTLEGSGVGYLGDAAMVVDRGAIEALGPQEDMLSQYQAEQVLELPHHVVLPGLIDAHMHTDIGICRGLAQDTKHWMMYGMGPFDDALSRKEEILGSKVCYMEALRAGTVLTNLRVIQRPGKDDPNRRFNTLESYRVASAA